MLRWFNLYDLYEMNGCKAGFYVVNRRWGRTVALVVSIADQEQGELPGLPPYHDNAAVLARFYGPFADTAASVERVSASGAFAWRFASNEDVVNAKAFR